MLTIDRDKKIHSRDISIATFDYDEAHVIVEGHLNDLRKVPYFSHSGEPRPPGNVHDLYIRLLVDKDAARIAEVDIEMPGIPHAACSDVIPNFSALEGIRIARGFTSKVRSLIGGPKGCAHLTGLLLAMASAALQGLWTQRAMNPQHGRDIEERVNDYLVDTCWYWRQGSPHIGQLLKGYYRD